MKRVLMFAVCCALLLICAWLFRYDIEPLRGFVVAKHDRWTGRTLYCDSERCVEPKFLDLAAEKLPSPSPAESVVSTGNPLLDEWDREKRAYEAENPDATETFLEYKRRMLAAEDADK